MANITYFDSARAHPHRDLAAWAMAATKRSPSARILRGLESHEDLLVFAKRNRIGPIVARALLDHDLLQDFAKAPWQAVYDASAARMRVMMDTLDSIGSGLASEGIRSVALKNSGIARGIHPDPACCPMGDLDILVSRSRFLDAHRKMLDLGFKLTTTSPVTNPADYDAGFTSGGTEYVKEVSGVEILIDLQWRPVSGRWIRPEREPDSDLLLASSVEIPGSVVRLLCPEHNMVQVALHTAKHAYCRAPGLRLHTDVDRLAVLTPPNWSEVVSFAESLRARAPIYFSFAIAKELLGTPVPDSVLQALAPMVAQQEGVAALLRRVDIFEPDQHKFNGPQVVALYALLHDDLIDLASTVVDADATTLTWRDSPKAFASFMRRLAYMVYTRARSAEA